MLDDSDFTLRDIIGPKRYSTFAAWRELQPPNWQRAIADAACFPYDEHPAVREQRDRVNALLDNLREREPHLFCELDTEIGGLASLSLGIGSVLGYALGCTWPTSIDELDGWVDRAVALVGEWSEL